MQKKTVLKKEYGFDKAFNIFNEIDNKCNKLSEYNPRAPNKIDAKNLMLEHFKIIEDKVIDMFYTPAIIRKINNANYKGYLHDKLKKEMNRGDTIVEIAILDSFKFKRQGKPQETIAERVKLNPRNKTGTEIKI